MSKSDEQLAEWRRVVSLESAGQKEELARWSKISAAANEPGFSGDLRRALLNSGRSLNELAQLSRVDLADFLEWMAGKPSLSSEDIASLVDTLGLHLVSRAVG